MINHITIFSFIYQIFMIPNTLIMCLYILIKYRKRFEDGKIIEVMKNIHQEDVNVAFFINNKLLTGLFSLLVWIVIFKYVI